MTWRLESDWTWLSFKVCYYQSNVTDRNCLLSLLRLNSLLWFGFWYKLGTTPQLCLCCFCQKRPFSNPYLIQSLPLLFCLHTWLSIQISMPCFLQVKLNLTSIKYVWGTHLLSHIWLFVIPGTVAHHTPMSIGFSRQEYWSGLPFPSPGGLPDPGVEPVSPALAVDSLPLNHLRNICDYLSSVAPSRRSISPRLNCLKLFKVTKLDVSTMQLWMEASQVALVVKIPTCQCRRPKRHGFHSRVGKIPKRRAWQPTPVFLPGESHWTKSLAGYSPQGHIESFMSESI